MSTRARFSLEFHIIIWTGSRVIIYFMIPKLEISDVDNAVMLVPYWLQHSVSVFNLMYNDRDMHDIATL